MQGYCDDIQKRTIENDAFRHVLYTGGHIQLVLMTLQPGEEIGEEVHTDRDQFFRFEEGEGAVDIDGTENRVSDNFAVIVPAGARHNVRNTGAGPLRSTQFTVRLSIWIGWLNEPAQTRWRSTKNGTGRRPS